MCKCSVSKCILCSGWLNSFTRIPALPFINFQLSAKKPQIPAYPKTLTTLGDHIRKRRLDLGLWQKDVAATLEVSESAVTGWEKNWFKPPPLLPNHSILGL
jgi:DNA-binding XRE family transcriptional regulator